MAVGDSVAETGTSTQQGSSGGVIVQVIAGVIVILVGALLFTNEQIERRTADRFLREYYGKAVQTDGSRDEAWDVLTSEFRLSRITGGRVEYNEYLDKWKEIKISQVQRISGDLNQFAATLTHVSRNGRAAKPERIQFVTIQVPVARGRAVGSAARQ